VGKKGLGELLSRFHHVGVLVKNMDEAVEYYRGLGIGPFESFNLVQIDRKVYGKPAPNVKVIAKGAQMGPIGFELVQPVSGKSVQKEWLKRRGEGINHLAFLVEDIEEATSIMVEAGFKVISCAKNKGGGGTAYFDTDKIGGVIIAQHELPPGVNRLWGSETSGE
jgi:4-hydroxyphenylpyruvate dioxygenase-like putative hemolysin|tara:strand:+ start:1089 stop:1583 length:495 start_codon:yes stop_codon:yes gene_type:complete